MLWANPDHTPDQGSPADDRQGRGKTLYRGRLFHHFTLNSLTRVFVQAWHDQYPLKPGRLYTVSVATSPFPMLAWRTDRVVYFLLADDDATEQAAAALIRGEPVTRPAAREHQVRIESAPDHPG
jgi:hypothetical protein